MSENEICGRDEEKRKKDRNFHASN